MSGGLASSCSSLCRFVITVLGATRSDRLGLGVGLQEQLVNAGREGTVAPVAVAVRDMGTGYPRTGVRGSLHASSSAWRAIRVVKVGRRTVGRFADPP
ncbi:MAG: hypothetical protein NZ703_03130, partial [Gemmataceae bacterium]|nr:hypothetical protein [Gemmataceae bacterium]